MSLRTKVSRSSLKKESLLQTQTEKVEMTLNTDSAVASGLLIQRLTELYEDPVEASVRETVSNGLDAVEESFSGEYPEVHITSPTNLNPVFTVKDNGVGMSYDDLKEIYSKYGTSTKMDNFDQIGAYGLGAKAPLAYGTEFTVTSVKDGEKTTIIVAREELTNYIKIVDSVKTNEPSGTTVSIPIDSGDIERFAEHIKKYQENPIDKDVKIFVDGEELDGTNYVEITDEVLIYKDDSEEIYGRLWIDKNVNTIVNLITQFDEEDIRRALQFLIGGWTYDSPSRRGRYSRYGVKGIIVELKAGIVGFNSSRDAILENDRYNMLESLVVDYFKSDQFIEDFTKIVNGFDLKTFKEVVMNLLNGSRHAGSIIVKDGKVRIDSSIMRRYHSSGIDRNYSISDFVHEETKFNFNDIIKDAPKVKKQTGAILEERVSYKKTSDNSISMAYEDGEGTQYKQFKGNNLSSILSELDKIMYGENNSHSLEVLMLNLAIVAYAERADRMRITFITDIEADKDNNKCSYSQLRSARKAIVRMRNEGKNEDVYQSYIIYTEHEKSDIQKMIETAKLDDLDITVESAKDMIEKVKAFRKKNRKSPKKVIKDLSIALYKYDHEVSKVDRIQADEIEVKKGVKNIIVVSRDGYVRPEFLRQVHSWYCNEHKVKSDEIQIYASRGQHKVLDVKVLRELGEMWEHPDSRNAGTSKVYDEAINGKIVELHTINEKDEEVAKKAFVRVLSGLLGSSPLNVMNDIIKTLEDANKLAESIGYDMPEVPEDLLTELGNYGNGVFGNSYGSYNWRVRRSAISHLLKNVQKDKHELLENLVVLNSSSQLKIKEDGDYNMNYYGIPTTSQIDASQVLRAYEEGNENHSYHKMIRLQAQAYLEHIKDISEALSTLKF